MPVRNDEPTGEHDCSDCDETQNHEAQEQEADDEDRIGREELWRFAVFFH